MRKFFIYTIILIMTLMLAVIYGISSHKYNLFPYPQMKKAYHYFMPKINHNKLYGPWSIGIYEGSTPFDIAAPEKLLNPVLTGKDVVDINATYVADPFMIIKDGKYFMFFEVMNREPHHGDIGYAESEDGRKWKYKKIVIDEEFHLSYPHVFEWNNDYYLIPESNQDFSVRLYKASTFPDEWEYVGNLLSGYHYVDPSIFRYKDRWWLFVTTVGGSALNLYYSEDLLVGWRPHPMNPIVNLDNSIARPGGRVIVYNDKLYRLTQDDDPYYGIQVFAFEITELSENSYDEKLVSETPIVTMTGSGWNAKGMHQVDLHKVGDKWIAAVDGRSR